MKVLANLGRLIWMCGICASGLFGSLSSALCASVQDPLYGGTSPRLEVISGNPAGFDVTGPSPTAGATVNGAPVSLSIGNRSEGFKITGPSLLPSSWVGAYTLKVTSKDANGVAVTKDFSVVYNPVRMTVETAVNGEIGIPAVAQALRDINGRPALTTAPFRTASGAALTGSYEVRAALRSDSTIPLMVNGVRVEPGSWPVSVGEYNFSNSDGRLMLPATVAENGKEGVAHLLLVTSAPDMPVVEVTVRAWSVGVTLSASSWSVRQAVDEAQITAVVDRRRCSLTANPAQARKGTIYSEPVCLFEWTPMPDGMTSSVSTDSSVVRGRLWETGEQQIGYRVSLFDGDGNQITLVQGSRPITVLGATDALAFATATQLPEAVYQGVETLEFKLVQSKGPACELTTNETSAAVAAAQGRLACLLRWTAVPDGMRQPATTSVPTLSGTVKSLGANAAQYAVDVIRAGGQRVTATVGSVSVQAIAPPKPTLAVQSSVSMAGGYYMANAKGGAVASVAITAVAADLAVTVEQDDAVKSTDTIRGYGASASDVGRRRLSSMTKDLQVLAGEAGTRSTYRMRVGYANLPEVSTAVELPVLLVPGSSVKPVIDAPSKVLNNATFNVHVAIKDISNTSTRFNPGTMGTWKVRLLNANKSTPTPLTDWSDASDGTLSVTLDAKDFGDIDSLRLNAEAMLLGLSEGAQRTEAATRPVVVTLLRAGPIASTVQLRRSEGAAPFMASAEVVPTNGKDRGAIGMVRWLMSSDGGQNWLPAALPSGSGQRFSATLTAGRYQLKAVAVNVNDGAESTTEPVSLSVYDALTVALNGPTRTLAGIPSVISVDVRLANKSVDLATVEMVWSRDGGASWQTLSQPVIEITGTKNERVDLTVKARTRSSPPELTLAWASRRLQLDFLPMVPPRVVISGPRALEVGKSGKFVAEVGLPYREVTAPVTGQWVLPDGTTATGTTVEWTAKEENLLQGSAVLTYRAQVDGFDDTKTSGSYPVTVWEYGWPTFALDAVLGSQYAPAEVSFWVKPQGVREQIERLEGLTYEWNIPAEATVVEMGRSVRGSDAVDRALLRVGKAGETTITVRVSDKRGHTSEVQRTVSLVDPPPYSVAIDVKGANQWNRAPLDIVLRPAISGGHPNDRVATLQYFVDGQPTETRGSIGYAKLPEGEHRIGLEVKTKFGQTLTAETPYTVTPNKKPTCGIAARETSTSVELTADCKDADGRMAAFRWSVNGQVQATQGNRVSMRRSKDPLHVELIGIDDSGDESAPAAWDAAGS